jgi:hypothetical protein
MVAGLLETQRASVWFPQCLRPTPAGLDVVSRRESAGNESDFGSLLSNIVRPSAREEDRVDDEVTEVAEVEDDAVAEAEVEDDAELAEQVEDDAEIDEAEVEGASEAVAEAEAAEAAEAEAEEDAELAEEAGDDAEVEAEDEEADEDDAGVEAEDEEEDEVVEYKEVEWKGVTYYVDAENQAYQMDSDGDLIDTPIGVWREETKKLVRYKQ